MYIVKAKFHNCKELHTYKSPIDIARGVNAVVGSPRGELAVVQVLSSTVTLSTCGTRLAGHLIKPILGVVTPIDTNTIKEEKGPA